MPVELGILLKAIGFSSSPVVIIIVVGFIFMMRTYKANRREDNRESEKQFESINKAINSNQEKNELVLNGVINSVENTIETIRDKVDRTLSKVEMMENTFVRKDLYLKDLEIVHRDIQMAIQVNKDNDLPSGSTKK